jgi:maltooligosyltrehalose trehalohydrolase
MHRFIVCLQNHDQVGNRALGERLHQSLAPEQWRAVSVLLLTAPMTPLLFMGQEWSAATPFRYFTDLDAWLGESITAGRRREFAAFPEFSDERARHAIPDPQAADTFESSRLNWEERHEPTHRAVLELYRALIALRLDHPALGASSDLTGCAFALDADTVAMRRGDDHDVFWVVVRFKTPGIVRLDTIPQSDGEPHSAWEVAFTTEEPLFSADPLPPDIELDGDHPVIAFKRAGGVILKSRD